MTITVFGSVNLDMTAYVEAMPQAGQTIHAGNYTTGLGGKGANQAVAASRIGKSAIRYHAAMGADHFGRAVRDMLAGFGVPTDDLLVMESEPTGLALIHVDGTGQNMITVIGGANMAWDERGPDLSAMTRDDILVVQRETPLPATLAAMRAARDRGASIILDPAPAPSASEARDLLAASDIVTPNETETQALTGSRPANLEDAKAAAAMLVRQGPKLAIVKLGEKGLAFADRSGRDGSFPAFRIDAVDTVAAGDSFCGALATALEEKAEIETALQFASAAGALCATKAGAASSIPDRKEVLAFLSEQGADASLLV